MPIPIGEDRPPSLPVVKRTALGQTFEGAIVNVERRNRQRRDPDTGEMRLITRPDGRPRQELVVTCLTISGTAPAGIGDQQGVPEPGDKVRLIYKGKAFADWIQAENQLKDHGRSSVHVGDVLKQRTTHAQVYDANGEPKGSAITTQEELDAVPRSATVGIYGELQIEPGEGEWVDKAEAAYRASNATRLASAGADSEADAAYDEPW